MNFVYVENPLTKRKVLVGSKKYRELVQARLIVPEEKALPEVQAEVKKAQGNGKVPCPPGKVRNPKTGFCIGKTGALYKKLLKEGVQFHDEDIPDAPVLALPAPPSPKKSPKKQPASNCKNHETFLYQTELHEVPTDDLLVLPSGYCFAISEIMDWVKSGTFNNIDPYNEGQPLFTHANMIAWSRNNDLLKAMNAYFLKERKVRDESYAVLVKNMEILYALANTGRITYFDNISSWENNNSGAFEYSIAAIAEFNEKVAALPKKVQDCILGLRLGHMTVADTIKGANEGTVCIHGVGTRFMRIFVNTFMAIEKMYPNIKYEPLRCGLYFVEEDKVVTVYNQENRLIPGPNTEYHTIHFKPWLSVVPKASSLIWKKTKITKEGLAAVFDAECPNDAFLGTLESSDEWHEVPEWRKMRLSDGYCFDLLFLIKALVGQLNSIKSFNPFPVYPTNIFTNKPLAMQDLISLRRRIVNNYITVAPCLMVFLYNPEILWSNDTEYTKSRSWREACIDLFEKSMRYRRLLHDFSGSEPVLHGCWIDGKTGATDHETKVIDYITSGNPRAVTGLKPFELPNSYYFSDQKKLGDMKHAYPDHHLLKQ